MTEDKMSKDPKKKILVVNKADEDDKTNKAVLKHLNAEKSSSDKKLNKEEVVVKEEPQELNPLGVPAFGAEEQGKSSDGPKKVIYKEKKATDVNPLSNLNGILDEKDQEREMNKDMHKDMSRDMNMHKDMNKDMSRDMNMHKDMNKDMSRDMNTKKDDSAEHMKDKSTMEKAKVKMAGAAAGVAAVAGGAYAGAKGAMSSEGHKKDEDKAASEHTKETAHNAAEKTKETAHNAAEKGHETKEKIKEEADKGTEKNESNSSKIKTGLAAAGTGIAGVAVGAYAGAKGAMSSGSHKDNEKKEADHHSMTNESHNCKPDCKHDECLKSKESDMTNKSHICKPDCKRDECLKSKESDQHKVIHVKGNDSKSHSEHYKDMNDSKSHSDHHKNMAQNTEEDNKSNSSKIKTGLAAAGTGIAGVAAGAYASAKSAVSKPEDKPNNDQDKDKVIRVKGSSHNEESKMDAKTGMRDNHVSIDENRNESFSMKSNSRHPEQLTNIHDSSIIHELRRTNSILLEGFAYKKRPWLFCFWVRKYFILLKTGELFFVEEDGSGEKSDFWNIKKATAIKKYDYYDYSHPYRLTFATDVSDGYIALDSEFDRDYWSKALLETSRCN